MNRFAKTLLWLVFIGLAGLSVYLWIGDEQPKLAPLSAPAGESEAARPLSPPAPGGVIFVPPPEALADPALPAAAERDAALTNLGQAALGATLFAEFFEATGIVRRIVVSVDALPAPKLALKDRLLRAVPGQFAVEGGDAAPRRSPRNDARYGPLVDAFAQLDTAALLAHYRQWYPLFQQAYAEIADPRALFNNRLIAVIDQLLAVKIPASPPRLVRPGVYYRYADAALEAQGVGAKMLLRLGPANAARVQNKLQEFRVGLTAAAVSPP